MFNAVSRQQLEEMLGYERFVLDECIRRLEEIRGPDQPQRLIIQDNPGCIIEMSVRSSISGPKVVEVYEQLTGLLFSTAYKVLDMIVEWTLRENGMPTTVWRFGDKVAWWLARPNIPFPDFLAANPKLVIVLQKCYQGFLLYRNAMIHGKWGKSQRGALCFDFEDKYGGRNTATFTPSQVMAWVEAINRVASMLLVPATATATSIKAVQRKLDLLQTHHAGPLFSLPGSRPFRVIRRSEAAVPFMVDIQRIRGEVERQARNNPYEVELRLEFGKEGNRECWEIPPEHVPTKDFFLDSTFDRYKVNP